MGIWARRIIKIDLADPSFKLNDAPGLMSFLELESENMNGLSEDGGMLDIEIAVLERAVRRKTKLELDEDTVRRLKEDIAFAKSNNDETVTYYCF